MSWNVRPQIISHFTSTKIVYNKCALSYLVLFEPGHSICYKIACAPSECSDLHSLNRVFAVRLKTFGTLAIDRVLFEDSDQIDRMRRLIWVFAGRICYHVENTVSRLSCLPVNCYRLSCLPVYTIAPYFLWWKGSCQENVRWVKHSNIVHFAKFSWAYLSVYDGSIVAV